MPSCTCGATKEDREEKDDRDAKAVKLFGSELFPMFTLPAETFLGLKQLLKHEDALAAGDLTKFAQHLGSAMFVSHQWLSKTHPDPHATQLRVMQDALRRVISGKSRISPHVLTEMFFGQQKGDYAEQLRGKSLFIWYDYLSVPQKEENAKDRMDAINSIPAYVARCEFFAALCPTLQHLDTGQMLTQYTWADRGWCRTERMARELSSIDGMIVLVESSVHQTLLCDLGTYLYSAGEGQFTVEKDKDQIAVVIKNMLRGKLMQYLDQGDLHNYRFFLNQQTVRLRGFTIDPIDDMLPFSIHSPSMHIDYSSVELCKFMRQNAFKGIAERDAGGFTPICYAAMSGKLSVVSGLLGHRACVNDRVHKSKPMAHLHKGSSVLALAARFSSNEVMKLLLEARASINYQDSMKFTALHDAAGVNNTCGIRILLKAAADPTLESKLATTALMGAAACGCPQALNELLTMTPTPSPYRSLHLAMIGGGFAENLWPLIHARASVDERFGTSLSQPRWWLLMKYGAVKHKTSPSRFTLWAHHHQDSTPLMFSIITSHFEATEVLLKAGANTKLRNSRGKTAADLAKDMLAPAHLIRLLEG